MGVTRTSCTVHVREVAPPTVLMLAVDDSGARAAPGAMFVAIGLTGSLSLAAIERAARSGDRVTVARMTRRFAPRRRLLTKILGLDRRDASTRIAAELSYCGRELVCLDLDSRGDAGLVVMPYNGARLTPSRFRTWVSGPAEVAAHVAALVVIQPPRLSWLEQQIARRPLESTASMPSAAGGCEAAAGQRFELGAWLVRQARQQVPSVAPADSGHPKHVP